LASWLELADAVDSKSAVRNGRIGSNPIGATMIKEHLEKISNEIAELPLSSLDEYRVEALDQTTDGYRIILEHWMGKKFEIVVKEIK
jgi:hypothetical protein